MAIIAVLPHKGENLTVEITDVFTSTRGKLATVRALSGEPFTVWTHGGWMITNSMNVLADRLQNVVISAELQAAEIPQEVQA